MRRLFCVAVIAVGTLALLRGGPSPWLLRLEVAAFSLAALAYGFTAYAPTPPSWLRLQEARGVACVYLGMGAMFIDPRFVVSAFFIGAGSRMIMTANWGSEAPEAGRAVVVRDKGGVVAR